MASGIHVYAGTRDGLQVLNLRDGRVEVVGGAFPGEIVQALTGCREQSERLFVGLRDGAHHSVDGGVQWSKVLSGDVRSITVDPSDDRVIYAGTDPVHLYRSEDAGDTWEELESLQLLPEQTHEKLGEMEASDLSVTTDPAFRHRRQDWWHPSPPHNGHILQIFVHPDDPNLIMLSIEHGGIARSTDRGKTWEDVSGGIDYLDIHCVTSVANRFDRYLASSARGLYATQDPLTGWTRAEKGCDRNYFHHMMLLPSANGGDPITIVATADGSPGVWRNSSRGVARAALYRSANCGESWQRIGAGNGLPEEMIPMIWGLSGHPDERDTIIASVGYLAASTPGVGTGSVILSSDGGESWRTLKDEMPAVDQIFVAAR